MRSVGRSVATAPARARDGEARPDFAPPSADGPLAKAKCGIAHRNLGVKSQDSVGRISLIVNEGKA
jgi:hypothetical protein